MPGRSVALMLVLALAPIGAAPQEGPAPFLLALKGKATVVNYTPGALDRAAHIQRRIELLAVDFSKQVKQQLRVRIFILSRDEWSQVGFALPYGLPGRIRGTTLAVPALGDAGTVSLWTGILGSPPPPLPGIPLKGTAEEASTLAMADLLTEVEAARLLLSAAGIRGDEVWVHQVLAHMVARMAFKSYEEPRLGEINAFFERLARGSERYALGRYSQGLDLATLLWFESRFHRGSRVLLEGDHKNGGRAILKLAMKHGGLVTAQAMLERHPELRDWLAEAFGEQR